MLDMLFDRLFGDRQRVGDLLVRPALHEIIEDGDFPLRKTESCLGLRDQIVLPRANVFQDNQHPGFTTDGSRQAETAEENGLLGITHDPFHSKVFPVFDVRTDRKVFDHLFADLRHGWRQDAGRRLSG